MLFPGKGNDPKHMGPTIIILMLLPFLETAAPF
jgi:hypothetical protein